MIIAENTTRPLETPPTCPTPQRTTLCNWQRSRVQEIDNTASKGVSNTYAAYRWPSALVEVAEEGVGKRSDMAHAPSQRVVLGDHTQQHRLLLELRHVVPQLVTGHRIHLRRNERRREGAHGAQRRGGGAMQGKWAGERAAGGHAPRRCRRLPHVLTVVYLSCARNQSARLPCACARAGCKGRTWNWGVGRAAENTSWAHRRRSTRRCA